MLLSLSSSPQTHRRVPGISSVFIILWKAQVLNSWMANGLSGRNARPRIDVTRDSKDGRNKQYFMCSVEAILQIRGQRWEESLFFLIFHLRSGWSCRTPLCCTLTQVTDSCNDRVTQPERAPPPRGTATPMLQWMFHPSACVLVFFSFTYNLKRSHLKASRTAEAHLHLPPTPTPRLADESNHIVSSLVTGLCARCETDNEPRAKLWVHVNNRRALGCIIPLRIPSID